ncbi:hypothetical protein PDESU_00881 [Pontiella desulfatans]|uniref:PEP-CTERM protein-sorting domain-containing protein n=1 Tax=Pontiella desulfatans TaxID=2750659 RepID=A0A6C2TXF5_PONDE|nr:hypothetical protein [Pontiella desulfatans]VGO12329.1 hypothetical protein PDESU_00881 [Pontiella desulfatans]
MKKTMGMMGLALVAILAVQSAVYGTTRSWKGTDSVNNRLMSRDGNWVGVKPGSGDIMQFNSSSTGSGAPNMNANFLVEKIKVASNLPKNVKMTGSAANSLRVRSVSSVGLQQDSAYDYWLNIGGEFWQDNAVHADNGGGTVSEVTWSATGAGDLIIESGSVLLDQDMNMEVTGAGVIDIRTAMAGGTRDVRKTGAGTLIYGAAMAIDGTVTVEGGTLQLGAAQAVNSASAMAFNDGTTLVTGGFGGDFNTLEVNGTVTFDLGGLGSSVLSFDDSSAVAWGTTLDIINYTAGDSIQFGIDGNGLSETQLAGITINGSSEGIALDSQGYLIPEPASVGLALFSGLGMLFIRRRFMI